MKYSVIIPAHNEERFLPECLNAIERAARFHNAEIEIIVVLNRCTDGTGRIAEEHGAKTIIEDRRNLAAIRNAGVRESSYDIIVTVDADSLVSKNLFAEIERALDTERYVGGGVTVIPERNSLGIALTHAIMWLILYFTGLGAVSTGVARKTLTRLRDSMKRCPLVRISISPRDSRLTGRRRAGGSLRSGRHR